MLLFLHSKHIRSQTASTCLRPISGVSVSIYPQPSLPKQACSVGSGKRVHWSKTVSYATFTVDFFSTWTSSWTSCILVAGAPLVMRLLYDATVPCTQITFDLRPRLPACVL
eukprot:GHVS01036234.1.p1 GENE.GHVS01036234.1~~GHVS01036234.1.p1  ORF type:complete len:111 (-),score=1.07 GHVS01036234.1:526-858(-)